jgi:four helix bundle protein
MQDPYRLRVYQTAEDIALDIYRLTRGFPLEERFGLAQQLRRAAVAIGSDIVEGCARSGARDFARFLEMSLGSAAEVRFQLRIAHKAGYLGATEHEATSNDLQQVQRMLIRLIKRVRPASGRSRRRPRADRKEPKTNNQ